jgi:hypothetical protein
VGADFPGCLKMHLISTPCHPIKIFWHLGLQIFCCRHHIAMSSNSYNYHQIIMMTPMSLFLVFYLVAPWAVMKVVLPLFIRIPLLLHPFLRIHQWSPMILMMIRLSFICDLLQCGYLKDQ